MRIGGVDFLDPLLNALRNGRLVIFVGTGISMGPPANLPGFHRLPDCATCFNKIPMSMAWATVSTGMNWMENQRIERRARRRWKNRETANVLNQPEPGGNIPAKTLEAQGIEPTEVLNRVRLECCRQNCHNHDNHHSHHLPRRR